MTEHPDRHDHLDDRELRAYTLRVVIATASEDSDARTFTCGEIEGRIHGCSFCFSALLGLQAILTVMILKDIGALEDTVAELERWLADLLDGTAP